MKPENTDHIHFDAPSASQMPGLIVSLSILVGFIGVALVIS